MPHSQTGSRSDAKQLAILIYDFLLEEETRKDLSKACRTQINLAVDSLKKVYRIRFGDYVFCRPQYSLTDLFHVGFRPMPVKNCIRAEKHKENGNKLMETRAYQLAEAEYTRAVQLDARNAIYFCNRSASRALQGAVLTAIEDCSRALELDPKYVKAYNVQALIHAAMDHPARALKCYRKALKVEPGNQVCLANMENIASALNHISLRVLQPVFRSGLNLASGSGERRRWFDRKKGLDVDQFEVMQRCKEKAEKLALDALD